MTNLTQPHRNNIYYHIGVGFRTRRTTMADTESKPGRKPKYSDEELLDHLRRLADGDDPPKQTEFNADPDAPAASTVVRQFGGWNKAVETAGLTPNTPVSSYTDDELIDHLRRLADGDTPPTKDEFNDDPDAPSASTVQNHFGSWNAGVKAAGLEPRSRRIPNTELLEQIRELADGDVPPTFAEFNDHPETAGASVVMDRFGGWNNAVEEAGLEPRRAGGKEKIIEQLQQLADGDLAPTSREFDEHPDTYSKHNVAHHLGSWNNAVEAAGLKVRKHTEVSKADVIEDLQKLAEDGKAPTAGDFNKHPDTASHGAVLDHFETWNEAIEAAGLEPNKRGRSGTTEAEIISHIKRLADGDDPPTGKEFGADPDAPSVSTVRNRFGSWSNGLEAAGFDSR